MLNKLLLVLSLCTLAFCAVNDLTLLSTGGSSDGGIVYHDGIAYWMHGSLRSAPVTGLVGATVFSTATGKGLAFDPDDMLFYISDPSSNVIRVVDATNGNVLPSLSFSISSPSTLNLPRAVYFHDRMLYVADTDNHRIFRIAIDNGNAGELILDQNNHPELSKPQGLTVNDGYLYFTMADKHVVRRVELSNFSNVQDVAGIYNDRGSSGDGGLATSAKLDTPNGLAFDTYGNLYIADPGNNNREIRMVNAVTGVISSYVGRASRNPTVEYAAPVKGLFIDQETNLLLANARQHSVFVVELISPLHSFIDKFEDGEFQVQVRTYGQDKIAEGDMSTSGYFALDHSADGEGFVGDQRDFQLRVVGQAGGTSGTFDAEISNGNLVLSDLPHGATVSLQYDNVDDSFALGPGLGGFDLTNDGQTNAMGFSINHLLVELRVRLIDTVGNDCELTYATQAQTHNLVIVEVDHFVQHANACDPSTVDSITFTFELLQSLVGDHEVAPIILLNIPSAN